MKNASPVTIRLSDYTPPAYLVDTVDLRFVLDPTDTEVTAKTTFRRGEHTAPDAPLVLDGAGGPHDARLVEIKLDGDVLAADRYTLTDDQLTIRGVPEAFTLEVTSLINASANTTLEGVYLSGGAYCTQCEAEGFRKITWFPDRPDVMATYRVTLIADKSAAPVLLSNGNLVDKGDVEGSPEKHYAVWEDPHKKPAYLFALVAGDLERLEDTFTTRSGREVTLHVYVEKGNLDQTQHCMDSLKNSMRWDEEVYGREYDLDIFNIVAVSYFNMGAMENKSLNIFNTKYVLAKAETATDVDYQGIEGVVGHEYFHNWSGNRVTCRDWFQLSLKEGFTVFRDQEFSADMGSRAVKRIDDVRKLRTLQFPEDAGPTSHPVRPDAYQEINNFYTMTVYEKGAEVVRMYHTLLGPDLFRKGTDLYFDRHDGQAVTCDDFLACMAEVSGRDLSQFARWYSQAGTPRVTARSSWDADAGTMTLTLSQRTPPTPGQSEKHPLHVPVKLGLLGPDGRDLGLRTGGDGAFVTDLLIELRDAEQSFVLEVESPPADFTPVPSLFRGFSAPIKLDDGATEEQLLFRLAHDSDAFNKNEAAQSLYTQHILSGEARASEALVDAFGTALANEDTDPALLSYALSLPSLNVLIEAEDQVDLDKLVAGRKGLRRQLADAHQDALRARYDALADDGPYAPTAAAIGRRMLRKLCLGYLCALDEHQDGALALAQAESATNMTERMAALAQLTHVDGPARTQALDALYADFKHEALVVDKWLSLQAMSDRDDVLDEIVALQSHEAFSMKNPNKVRSLIGAFAMNNLVYFHDKSGRGYRIVADVVLALDELNPQIAARLVQALGKHKRFDEERAALMKAELERIFAREGLSRNVHEMVGKALAN